MAAFFFFDLGVDLGVASVRSLSLLLNFEKRPMFRFWAYMCDSMLSMGMIPFVTQGVYRVRLDAEALKQVCG